MKRYILALAILAGLSAAPIHAAGFQQVIESVPATDDTDSTVYVSSSTGPTAVVVSSAAITQLDTTVNSNLNTALGATYKRASIIIQNNSTVAMYLSYAASGWTTSTGGWKLNVGDTWTFQLGKGIHLYGLSTAGTAGEARVGGIGYK